MLESEVCNWCHLELFGLLLWNKLVIYSYRVCGLQLLSKYWNVPTKLRQLARLSQSDINWKVVKTILCSSDESKFSLTDCILHHKNFSNEKTRYSTPSCQLSAWYICTYGVDLPFWEASQKLGLIYHLESFPVNLIFSYWMIIQFWKWCLTKNEFAAPKIILLWRKSSIWFIKTILGFLETITRFHVLKEDTLTV